MAAIDSVPVFLERVKALGLLEFYEGLCAYGWSTMGTFAFATSPTMAPVLGPADDDRFMADIGEPLIRDDQRHHVAAFKRLHFECYTMCVADLQRRANRNDHDDRPRALPAAERAARLEEIRALLVGLDITGDLEPSDTLVDKFVAMQESGVLRYLPWTEIGQRDAEIRGQKKDEFFKFDSSGALRLTVTGADIDADTCTDYKLHRALQRRGIALHIARLMDFSVHEILIQWMMKEYARDAMPGHAKVTVDQLARADEEIFVQLGDMTRAGLGLDQNGQYPLNSALERVLAQPRILMLLNPRPVTGAGGSQAMAPEDRGWKRKMQSELDRLSAELKKAKSSNDGGRKKVD